jgi:hypothetical protein
VSLINYFFLSIFKKLIQKDFFQVHTQISKILSTNGISINGNDKTSTIDAQMTPINKRISRSKCNQILIKKVHKKSSKSKIDFTKFQPDFASTPTYKLPVKFMNSLL